MCLVISYRYHPIITPKTATFPIVVWKGLEKSGFTDDLISPYQGTIYKFGKLYRAKMGVVDNIVRQGLHATITRSRALYHARRAYPALIPVGSKFFLSFKDDYEIVSNRLIVFKNMADLEAYAGTKVGPRVNRNTL